MKYFSMFGYAKDAVLIDPDGNSFEPFSVYKNKLFDNCLVSLGSLNDYLGHVARFIEYVYAASLIGLEPTKQNLDVIISGYESYLLHAEGSSDDLAREIACLTGRTKPCSPTSLPVIEAALTHFLNLSDSLAKASGKDGLFSRYLPNVLVPVSASEAAKLRCGSMLGGVIRGGAKSRKSGTKLFRATKKRGTKRRNSPQKQADFDFPLDRIGALLEATSCFRDKALYALLASGGMRGCEAMQIRVEDIDVENRLVYVYSPFERENPGLTENEFGLLKWKGRETSDTFLIEPWATVFFDSLRDYFRYEFIPNQGHPFIFQTLSGESRGRPYFAGDRSARIKQFKLRAAAADVKLPWGVAIHSLRHSYGIYVLNYLPTPTGLGMSITLVANLMGHADIKNTKVYARHDEEIIRVELEYANQLVKGGGQGTKTQMLINYYQQRISELESQ